jgi:hypothetical protein
MVSPGWGIPGRGWCVGPDGDGLLSGFYYSAKGPVSRILSCAVIPLDAALPRTFISDLPGGFANSSSRLTHRADAQRRMALCERFPPYLVLLRVGFTLPPALPPERCALTAPFHPYPGAGVYATASVPGKPANSGIAFPGRPSGRFRRSGEG